MARFAGGPSVRGWGQVCGPGRSAWTVGAGGPGGPGPLRFTRRGHRRGGRGRLVELREGEILAVTGERRTELRRTRFGFVFELGHPVPDLPAAVNVALPLMLNGMGRRRAEYVALDRLERFGVGDLAGRRPGDTSVGQAQRVAVAIADRVVRMRDGRISDLGGLQPAAAQAAAAREGGAS